MWNAGLLQKTNSLQTDLLGKNPIVLEELLVRRVANGRLARIRQLRAPAIFTLLNTAA